jgi:thiol peroxidase
MSETVTLKGQTFTLKGELVREGQTAPDCELTGPDLKPLKLSSFKGKALVLLSVPSLDTSVCSTETRRFNLELEKFQEWLTVVCVSMDLPFAQSRWCAAEGIKNVVTLSDYKNREFGEKYGVFIKDLGLLARAVFLVDTSMRVLSMHLVKEITQEPDYAQILERVNKMAPTARK